jgi:hypothetical protein
MCDGTAAWNTPNPAASALSKSKSASSADLREDGLLSCAYVIEPAREADRHPSLRPGCEESPADSREGQFDRWQLDSADSADHSSFGHAACDHALEVGCFLDFESQPGDICWRPAPGSHDEPGLRRQPSHFERSVCVLESVREDDIETARGNVTQRILEICRRLRLHQRRWTPECWIDSSR